jgi:transcriptional regulator with XRE-family HTH domain
MGKIRPTPLSPGVIFGRRVRDERQRQGLRQDELVDRLAKLGRPMDRSNLGRIERGETTGQLDNVMALALALGVAPIHLLVPRDAEEKVELAPKRPPLAARTARLWISGRELLPDSDWRAWVAAMPDDELQAVVGDSLTGGTPLTRALASGPLADRVREHIEDDFAGRATARKRRKRRTKEGEDG